MPRKRLSLIVSFAAAAVLAAAALPGSSDSDNPTVTKRTAILRRGDKTGRRGRTSRARAHIEGNAVFGGTPYTVGKSVVIGNTGPQGEEHIAVQPGQPNNLVAAISDFSLDFGYNTTKYSFSADGGATWKSSFVDLEQGAPVTGDGRVWDANSDPVVAADRSGRVYMANLFFNGDTYANGIYVSVSDFSQGINSKFTKAATYPVALNTDPNTELFEDKEWIAVDNSGTSRDGTVYVAWAHFRGVAATIYLSHSGDHGATWSIPVAVSPESHEGFVQGAQVAVGPAGEVYVAYEFFLARNQRKQYLAKSVDGGQTFTTPGTITPYFNELDFGSIYRVDSFPSLAVSPTNGDVYVVYSDQPSDSVGAQVEFIKSADGGATFSLPVTLNDNSAGNQFFPAIATDTEGRIHVCWIDTRRTPFNPAKFDIFASRSVNAGATWTHNSRLTKSQYNAGSSDFIGDYIGIAADGGFAHPVWCTGGLDSRPIARLATTKLQ